jgi:ubiquinone biosynthesis protein
MAKLLTLLFEITGLFDMKTRPELLLLQKTMVVVEGVARSFDPNLDMWATAEPVVREWIERHLGPAGRLEDVAQGAGEVGPLPRRRARPARPRRHAGRPARRRDARRPGAGAETGCGDRAGGRRGATAGPRWRCG